MTRVTFRVSGLSSRAESVRAKLPGSQIERGDVLLTSPLGEDRSLNEHLLWLWGMLKFERRYLKKLVADGAHVSCVCHVPKGEVRLLPNGAGMLHLVGAELILEAR